MYALAEVAFGKKDYGRAENLYHQANREIMLKVGMRNQLFYESTYLISQIYQAKGDIEEAEAYSTLLPPEFHRMTPSKPSDDIKNATKLSNCVL